ncbi:AMP-binding protein [Corynebacterium sp.]|uniref:AMP-binding protein n=1 Tax=Corynebacterium sp. TaxID=1720 RepID=UPI0026496DDD|nr:AMP-binding protein [Corynebacterium sp.]MDN6374869.1 AMP-binding protein [Corynebacterium sp.]
MTRESADRDSGDRDLLVRILRQAQRTPEAPALTSAASGYTRTYGEVVRDARDIAARISGVTAPGERVILVSDDEPETYVGLVAAALAGVVPAIVAAASPAAALVDCATAVGAGAVIIRDGLRRPGLSLPTVTVPTATAPAGTRTAAGTVTMDGVSASPDAPLLMLFTSGTTGRPKSVVLPRRALHAIPDILREHKLSWIDWHPGEMIYTPLPAAHIGGVWWILNGLVSGCHCVTGHDPGSSLSGILRRWRIASVCMVPTLLGRLASELRAGTDGSLRDLRLVVYGGSRADDGDVGTVEESGARTAQIFGLSETGCTALCLPTAPGSLDRIRAGQVGRPYPGVSLRVIANPAETPVNCGVSDTEGTLWIRTPGAMLGYHDNPGATAATLVDGWVNTGDRVTVDDDGYVTLRGRVSELIICGGSNVMPDDVDRIATSVAGVQDAAAFEIPDRRFGAVVGLAVIPEEDAPEGSARGRALKRTVAAEFRDRAEPESRPVRITIVDHIPRTASGKVRRGELRSALVDAREGAQ